MGCQKPVHFPLDPLERTEQGGLVYDTNGDEQADFFLYTNGQERIHRIGYDRNYNGQCDEIVDIDQLPFEDCRHLVIILDGFSWDVVSAFYDGGGLRMFYKPSKVIAPYPTLTDLCMEDIFGYISCPAYQSIYFDRNKNRIVGGKGEYLKGLNQPYNVLLDYRSNLIWDAIGYVYPRQVFGRELNQLKRKFDKAQKIEFLSYIVSSAGISTKFSVEGQVRALRQIDAFVMQVLQETRGQTKVTLLSDHGHCYTKGKLADFDSFMKSRGWKPSNRINTDRCVVDVPFGVLTCNYFWARQPGKLAADLVEMDGVELASYVDFDKVIVLSKDSKAIIAEKNNRFAYMTVKGDPLELKQALAAITPDEFGYYCAKDLLKATVDSHFPAPLQRLWRAHFTLAHNCPDVIVSLADDTYSGLKFFARFADAASTHGSLNRINSTTFIMSTAGQLDDVMLTRDIPKAMENLTGREFPLRK